MKLVKKNKEEIYAVVDDKWFEQYTDIVSEPDDNGMIYDFFNDNVKGLDIEEEYCSWQQEHFTDYYFTIVKSKQGDFYAVAYEGYNRAAYACEIENPYE